MCGIIGIAGNHNSVSRILLGLKRLEYRGYDSSGISVVDKNNKIKTIKKKGKIGVLEKAIKNNIDFDGHFAIGHTRWATHGKPNEKNSHPHLSNNLSVVHNGIIENYQELRLKLEKEGYKFVSQTDSEVIPHLISYNIKKFDNVKIAFFNTIKEIKGAFAIAVLFENLANNFLAVAKQGSPLLIGYGENENYVASDYSALSGIADKITYLEDGDISFISNEEIQIYDSYQNEIKRDIMLIEVNSNSVSKENYPHFMLKEIFEQPKIITNNINNYVDLENYSINLPNFPFRLSEINKITIVACGTSYYAGMAGKYLIESIARVNVEVEIASEFRYNNTPLKENNLVIFISQSGETADTIAALKFAKSKEQKTLAIVNTDNSSISYLSDVTIKTIAGIEIGVASTKAFTAQLVILILTALKIAEAKESIPQEVKKSFIDSLTNASNVISNILTKDSIERIQKISKYLVDKNNILYTGRGISYVTALEGSLKLKELSYINSHAIAAGELKHGTIALVDKTLPVIVIAPDNDLFDKSASNIQEIIARDGKVILIGNKLGIQKLKSITTYSIEIPRTNNMVEEILCTVIPTQLIAYYVAFFKGNNVDQPRNLAKSVTVE